MAGIEDIFADAQAETASQGQLSELSRLVSKAVELEGEIESLEAVLKARKGELFDITDRRLPEMMDEAKTLSFTASNGRKVELKDDVHASISKENKPEAHAWLRANNHEDIIKNQITVKLDRKLDNVAGEIIRAIKDQFGIDAERDESVHAQTLKAFCREQLEAGTELPAALLGLFIRRVAVIKDTKKKK